MRTLSETVQSYVLLMTVALLISGCATVQDQATAEQYIQDGSRQWAESVATGNTTDLERIIAEDFIGIDPQGNLYDKAKMLENTREAPKYFASNKIGPVKVRFYGDTAVAQGEETWVRHRGNPVTGRFVWTDTWVRRNGNWQIVAAQDVIAKAR